MRLWIAVSLVSLLCPVCTFAQTPLGFGTVSGQIIEAGSHDGLPDAQVLLSNDALGFRRIMKTSDDGFFSAPATPAASGYVITVTRKDFADFVTTPFIVFVGRTLSFTINAERITAEAAAAKKPAEPVDAGSLMPQVETTKVGVALTTRQAEIDDLPSNARRLDTFALLAPATARNTATGQVALAGDSDANAFFLDGILVTNTYFGSLPGIANQVSQDATFELQTYPVGATVEWGHSAGGGYNAASHVGENQFHGAVYGYERLPSLGTASRFALGQNLLKKQHQEGASVGGFIWPHKVYFFANTELLNGHFEGVNRILNPLIADSTGTVVSAANCKATAPECAAAIKIIQPQMNVAESFSDRWLNALGRIDYRFNDRHTFGVEVNGMNSRAPLQAEVNAVPANGGLLGIGNSTENTRLAKLYWTATVKPNMLNDLRASWVTDKFFQPASAPGATGDLAVVVAGTTIGNSVPDPLTVNERRWDVTDNFTITAASHMIEAGGEYLARTYRVNQLPYANGLYIYPTLTAYATDLGSINQRDYTSFTQSVGNPSTEPSLRERNLYAQDTWRPTPRWTIIGGVRWDHYKVVQPTPSTSFFNTGAITSPNINWAPRVGIAFQSDPHTVLRVGYTWFYQPLPGLLYNAMYSGDGVLQSTYSLYPLQSGAPVYPKIFTPTTITTTGAENLFTAQSKLRNPRIQQITAAIEERLSNDISLTVSFINSRGYKLYTATDTNFALPVTSETYAIDNGSGTQVGTYNTQIYSTRTDNTHGHVYQVQNGGSSYYTAGALQLQKRMGHGFSAQLAYTYSRPQTDDSGPLVFNAAPISYSPADFSSDKGESPVGQKNRGTLGLIWRPTLGPNYMSVARALVNGWAVSNVVTVASAGTETPLAIVTAQQFAGAVLLYPSSLNGSGGWGRVPFEGVGALRTGSLHTWDMRVSRDISFTARFKATVLIEGFNILNNQYITGVNDVTYTATAGVLKPVVGAGDGNAAQGYPQGTNARSIQAAFRVVF
jgi:TonB dependent receptor